VEDLIFDNGAIATITINRPKALNALNRAVPVVTCVLDQPSAGLHQPL
jgi:hypothetical protein